MTLFSKPTDIWSHRTRLVLAEKSINIDIVDVDERSLPEDLLDLNPYNSIPTLVDRDLVLYDSRVIIEYLDERFPHPPLLPVYPVQRALSRLWITRVEREWSGRLDVLMAGKGRETVLTKARKELRESIISIAPIFAEKPFFMSDEFTLVDCCIAPILWRLPSLGIELRPGKQTKPLLTYMDALFNRDSFQESLSDQEREMRL